MGSEFKKWMVGIGAVIVVVLGIIMFSRGAAIAGIAAPKFIGDSSPGVFNVQASETLTDKAAANSAEGTSSSDAGVPAAGSDVQYITSTLSSGAYPNIIVQSGIPVEWTIHTDKGVVNGCNGTMVISAYGLQVKLREGDNLIKFTPTDTGTIAYSCWMGMITGQIQVEETAASSGQTPSDTDAAGAITDPAQNSFPDTSATLPAEAPIGDAPVGGCCGI